MATIITSFLGLSWLLYVASATEYRVGGGRGWSVPLDSSENYLNLWAEKSRFRVGDTLVFVYPSDKDSVLQVSKDAYTNCNTSSPFSSFNDGYSLFKLNQSGPFYFISGFDQNCNKNEKMVIVVMADRNNRFSSPIPLPSPSPSDATQTNVSSPSPSPSPSVPSPALAPVPQESPSPPSPLLPNGASSMVLGLMGSYGIFLGSSLLFSL